VGGSDGFRKLLLKEPESTVSATANTFIEMNRRRFDFTKRSVVIELFRSEGWYKSKTWYSKNLLSFIASSELDYSIEKYPKDNQLYGADQSGAPRLAVGSTVTVEFEWERICSIKSVDRALVSI
jgi:hypothetical protein